MEFIKANEQIPEIWKVHGSASKRLNLKVQGFVATGRYLKDNDCFEIVDSDGHCTVFERESFHLIEWLDEQGDAIRPDLEQRAKAWVKQHESWVPDEQSEGAMFNAYLAGAANHPQPIDNKIIKNTIWSLVHAWQMSDGDDTKDRWLAVEKYVLSIASPNISFLPDKLREFNPYLYNKEQRLGVVAWKKACDTLQSILNLGEAPTNHPQPGIEKELSEIKKGLWQLSLGETPKTEFSEYVVRKAKELMGKLESILKEQGGEEASITCVFCEMPCEPAPTNRGWSSVRYGKGLHFDCAGKVVDQGNIIGMKELEEFGKDPTI